MPLARKGLTQIENPQCCKAGEKQLKKKMIWQLATFDQLSIQFKLTSCMLKKTTGADNLDMNIFIL